MGQLWLAHRVIGEHARLAEDRMAVQSCRACGLALRAGAKFCDGCGASVGSAPEQAEYKQVTVLFADVVGSMQLASALGPEGLREVVAEVFTRSSAAVQRYGGTVDKFTGDGIMAVFGAPTALEDHALRACLAALDSSSWQNSTPKPPPPVSIRSRPARLGTFTALSSSRATCPTGGATARRCSWPPYR